MALPRRTAIHDDVLAIVDLLIAAGRTPSPKARQQAIRTVLEDSLRRIGSTEITEASDAGEAPKELFVNRPLLATGVRETGVEFFDRVWRDDVRRGLGGPAIRRADPTFYAWLAQTKDEGGHSLLGVLVPPTKPGRKRVSGTALDISQARERKRKRDEKRYLRHKSK